jgi:hypothetical protein
VSTLLGAAGGRHCITVELPASVVDALPHSRMQHTVDWPHMWRPGDPVAVETADGIQYAGLVLEVSHATRAVLIELDHLDPWEA